MVKSVLDLIGRMGERAMLFAFLFFKKLYRRITMPHPMDKVRAIIKKYKLSYIGSGFTRHVYKTKSGRYVIKFPINPYDEKSNEQEAKDYLINKGILADRMAKCRLIKLDGITCLIMQKVKLLNLDEDAEFCKTKKRLATYTDGGQVGYNRKGKLVAYDWSNHYHS